MTKEEIFNKLKSILADEFEIEEGKITPDALLVDDLDLDSIDTIDLIGKTKDFIPGGKVDPAIFKTVKTMQDVVDALLPYTQQA
ncbi:MAG: acyl carrier protein [Treponema sp.]|nr:acyl carrier protein [Treponema sp.]